MATLGDLRHEYEGKGLDEADLPPDPADQFARWIDEALRAGLYEPTAMTLATVDKDGGPAARIVLLKDFGPDGFVFFTNYDGDKARQLAARPRAALVFYWPELHRQVRITGVVTKTAAEQSAAYFHSRPRGSQLGAWASRQSEIIADRMVLENALRRYEAQFADADVPCPPNWGGYLVAHDSVEFWQGRPNRLHDRLRYVRQKDGTWKIQRLAP